jgi:rhomboid protease GluP
MNMWVLYDVGAQVEEVYGASRMYVIYFVANFFGFVASNIWSGTLSIGASAAIFGLIGAMIALGVRHRNPMGAAIRAVYIRWAIWGLVIGFLPLFSIDNAAHIGGVVSGFGVGWLAGTPRLTDTVTEKLWKVACFFCILITAVSFLEMYLSFAQNAQ